jgi:hypothetical protein
MTPREQLTQEIAQAPDALLEEILDFCLFIKQRKSDRQPHQAPTQTSGILDLLEQVKAIQAQVPPEEWDKLPHDGAINHDHYLYGAPKIAE